MTMTSAAGRRRSLRDSEADVETEIYTRPAMAWDRVMVLQIMRDLDKRPPRLTSPRRSLPRVPPPGEPNVFLTPWTPADPMPPWSKADGRRRTAPTNARALRKSAAPWLVFVMAFGIAFGIGGDRQLRRELGSKLRAATSHAASLFSHHALR